ncbi:MAG: polynucleotide kinase-phosphatase [Oscillospiraceae bacterium]|nr:polynucleotide kinase-phosphatase [Oscillospiraceae bacterium]
MRIEIPELALVALVGGTSSGKTTFARKYFRATEILSSDFFRALICDDENSQDVSGDAFDLLYAAAEKRLQHGKLTVIDATNLQQSARKRTLDLAKAQNVHSAAIVLNLPEKILRERNQTRTDRDIPDRVIRKHCEDVRRSVKYLKKEGFRFVYVLKSPEEIENLEIVRTKLWSDKKEDHGALDVIGDIHGCARELELLLAKLGYSEKDGIYQHPEGRRVAFLGDFCDRGNQNVRVLQIVMAMVKSGNAFAVTGNHDAKLVKYLKGKKVAITHGFDQTIQELNAESETFRQEVRDFLDGLISHYVFDDGKLVIAHAGLKQEYIGRGSGRVRKFCLYGETTGETDEYGLPVRLNWAADYRGRATIIYGHVAQKEVQSLNGTHCIDTGCVFGGKLTAYRYPEQEFVSVNALETYCESVKPLDADQEKMKEIGDLLTIQDYQGKLYLQTGLLANIQIQENQLAAALEIMSRFAADPHWLIYLPPTMSPCATSEQEAYLEYPLEAFEYYQKKKIRHLVCEQKHMGSRAVMILCRNPETAKTRFGVDDGTRGIIYTRTGRRFFDTLEIESKLLDRLDNVLTKKGFWKDFQTDWVCLDTELMPWSEKAKALLKNQYAPVGNAGKQSLSAAVKILEQVQARTGQGAEILESYREKENAISGYIRAYQEYCWDVQTTEDFRIAPFHILAAENQVFSEKSHLWHMETIRKYMTGIDPIFMATPYKIVDTEDESSIRDAVNWWLELTAKGGEGMVVKPEYFTAWKESELLQPAVKCRGREYLRIIYGAEYLHPEYLMRLKKRSLHKKRTLALKEFSLGIEALQRFVRHEPLYKIHECVFGVLAFESEPVDPRL